VGFTIPVNEALSEPGAGTQAKPRLDKSRRTTSGSNSSVKSLMLTASLAESYDVANYPEP
jgi:hypothetical protein